MLQQVTQRPDEVTHNIASQNNDKNRSNQFLPRKRKGRGERENLINKCTQKLHFIFYFLP